MKQKERDTKIHEKIPSAPSSRPIARFWSIGVALLSIVVAVAWTALQLSLPADGYSSSFGKLAPPGAVVDADLVTDRPMAPTASEESIAQGDIITAIGGHTIEEWLRASLSGPGLSNREWQVGATIPYTILRAGQEQTVTVRLIRLSLADIVPAGLSTWFLVFFILALTIFMVIQKPDEPATHVLLVCVSATTVLQIHEVIDLQVSLIVHPALFWGDVLLENFSIWFCYAPLAHAFLIFPEKKKIVQRFPVIIWLIYLIYPVFVLGGALLGGPAVASHLAGAGRWSTLAMILLFVILGVGIGHSFFTARTLEARSQIRWIAWGFAAGMMPLLFLHLLPRDLFGQAILSAEIALIPIFLAPLALTIAIVRHNLFDIELIINRSLVYGTLSVLLGSLYLLLVRSLTLVTQAITPAGNEASVVFMATLTITLAFAPLRQRVQGMIDRAFYRTKLDYQRVLSEMSAQLATNIVLERLVPLLTEELPRRLQIARASLLVLNPEGQILTSFDDVNGTGLSVDHPLAENLRRSGQPLLRSHAEQHLPDEASAFLQSLLAGSVELSIPLLVSQRLVGVYNLGAKLSGISYTRDEVQLLTVLGQQAAVSVENARLYQKIEGYSRTLEQKVEQRTAELTTANEQLKQEITERKRAEDALQRAHRELAARAAELEAANAELSQYAYVVSHDLKTPLRAVHNYADFLRQDLEATLDGDQKAYLDGLGRAVQEAEDLVEDLLALSRIGRRSVPIETVDVGAFLRELLAILSLPADVEIVMADDWPTIVVEPVLLGRILQNLIGNAVKFNTSPHKRVELGWRPVARSEAGHSAGGYEFFVRDNGIGIAPRYHEQIFRMFERLHTSEEYEGTGIGLAIVKKAASKLGGSVRVESKVGEGSTFFVTLPTTQKER